MIMWGDVVLSALGVSIGILIWNALLALATSVWDRHRFRQCVKEQQRLNEIAKKRAEELREHLADAGLLEVKE